MGEEKQWQPPTMQESIAAAEQRGREALADELRSGLETQASLWRGERPSDAMAGIEWALGLLHRLSPKPNAQEGET